MSSDLSLAGAPLALRVDARARRLRLKVDPRSASLVLTVPRAVSRRRAVEWALRQEAWAREALAAVPASTPLGPGAIVPLYGRPHMLVWREAGARRVQVVEGRIELGGPRDGVAPRLLRWLKHEARRVLDEETHHYAALAGVSVARVGIGDPSSRWGSCSSSGTISYSWRLILAPDHVRRATVAHEVAHRVHMNHGPEFHALVKRLFGADPDPARQWLRKEGAALQRFGR